MKNRIVFFALLAHLALATGFANTQEPQQRPAEPELKYERDGDWKPIFKGVSQLGLHVTSPRPMQIIVVKIELETPGLEFVATPDNGERPKETDGAFTSTFLKEQKCQLAINAAAFGPVTDTEGTGQDILGLHVVDGKQVSPWQNGYHFLAIEEGNIAKIHREEVKDLSTIKTAVSGFNVVLWDGRVLKRNEAIHPRTVVGLSQDQKVMYWMVIDGRQPSYSVGAKVSEAAQLMKDLGAFSALNLDGGGTSTLVIEGEDGLPKVLNRPVHGGIPGKERPTASHLGLRAPKIAPVGPPP
jgi:hypothetical protein